MEEKVIVIDSVNPVNLFGVNHSNLKLIRKLFPDLKLSDRGNDLKIIGKSNDIEEFKVFLSRIVDRLKIDGNINEDLIFDLFKGPLPVKPEENELEFKHGGTILIGNDGLLIKAKTPNQSLLVKSCAENDMVFATGPSGTGKTYTAVALAVKALKNKEVRKIILTRPAVEAGESLGFLPGDLKEKLDPYLQPLYDALRDMIIAEKLKSYLESGVIQIAPLAYMRGRTLDHAFVILDEAQNATRNQMKMFLTRMGQNAKFIITGDITQTDLPRNQNSGLPEAIKLLEKIKGIGFVTFDKSDVLRHKLVKKILHAYDED